MGIAGYLIAPDEVELAKASTRQLERVCFADAVSATSDHSPSHSVAAERRTVDEWREPVDKDGLEQRQRGARDAVHHIGDGDQKEGVQ